MKQNKKKISVIIPTLNETDIIGNLLKHLHANSVSKNILEIIVVDGGSTDDTVSIAKQHNAYVIASKKGRAKQLNYGAKNASGDILYFLHADTLPPKGYDQLVLNAVNKGHNSGCFRMQFDSKNPILRFFGWLSRINHTLCRGGDQSLFVTKNTFNQTQGFNEDYLIYEDSEFIKRLYKDVGFVVLPEKVITSARKYRQKGWFRVQYHFGMIHLKSYLGAGPDELYEYYSKKLLA